MYDVRVHALTPKAQIALIELHREYEQKVSFADFITPPRGYYAQLSREYEAKLKEIVSNGMRETANDRMVRIKCPQCGRRESIPGDVQRFKCVCSPHTERFVFQAISED